MTDVNFRSTILDLAPTWLQGTWGSRLLYSFGVMFDSMADGAVLAAKAGLPSSTLDGALARVGAERNVPRGIVESDAGYRVRLGQWVQDRRIKGSPYALLRQFKGYLTGYVVNLRTVSTLDNWHEYDGVTNAYTHITPGSRAWDWDGDDAAWARFWVIVQGHPWSVEPTWGNGTWGDGGTWGSTATPEEIDTLRMLANQWKPAGTRCEWIILTWSDTYFDPNSPSGMPNGTWGKWGYIPVVTAIPVREADARYISGAMP